MKKAAASFACAVLCIAACAPSQETGVGMERTRSFAEVRAQFKDPGKEFRPAPLWTWNAKVNHEDIDRMLADFKEEGFGGAFIHPRPGMETEYLSEDWFELWRYSYDKGKELGLDIWIYDENSFPSGFAGGHVQREMPESYDHPSNWSCDKFDSKPEDTGAYDLCKEYDGTWYCFKALKRAPWRFIGKLPYVDLIYPGVTEKFIDITMSGYEKEFGEELGTGIKGVFMDEPTWLQWTPDLPQEFEKDWGYDVMDCMPMLFDKVGDWKRVRCHLMYTKTRLWMDRWAKPWYNYCEEHNLLRTGHYGEHMWPHLELGDYPEVYSYHQMPAIDLLFNTFDINGGDQFGNVRIVKEVSSVANQMGYTRTLSETYGGAGWDLRFEDLKRLGDWEYVTGINFMCQHYANVTMEGARKFDWPDFFTGYSPWAADYRTLNDHYGRLSLAMSQGDQVNDVLVIQPNTTLWQYFSDFDSERGKNAEIGAGFRAFINKLEAAQVEYDLGSEMLFRSHGAYVQKGKLVMGKRAYSTVILPEDVETLLSPTDSLLEEFVKQGGRLIALSQPTLVDTYENEGLKALWNDGRIEKTCDLSALGSDKISFHGLDGGLLYHHRRDYDDGQLLLLVNSSLEESAKGSVTIEGSSLVMMDTMTGEEYAYDFTSGDGSVTFGFDLSPAGSLLVFAPAKARDAAGLKPAPCCKAGGKALEPASEMKVSRVQDNCLLLDYCDVELEGKTIMKDRYVTDAGRDLYRKFGIENPWQGTVQYKREIVDNDTLSSGDINIRYKFHVNDGVDPSKMKLVIEKPRIWDASINGHALSEQLPEHPLDARNGAFAIGDYVKTGENVVTLHISSMSIFAEVTYAYLYGDFNVKPSAKGWEICAPAAAGLGDWPSQGMPFYSWDMAYSQTYEIEDISVPHVLKLGDWLGAVCEVFVNGEKAGVIAYSPFEFNLTPFLKKGANNIEVRCIGTFANLYGPHFREHGGVFPPGAEYDIDIVHPGKDYRFNPYGLKEPFMVFE